MAMSEGDEDAMFLLLKLDLQNLCVSVVCMLYTHAINKINVGIKPYIFMVFMFNL